MKDEPLSSVRVEVNSHASATDFGPITSPEPGDGSDRSTGSLPAVAAAGVLVIALIAVLVLLRPDEGQTAAGTDRGPTTTESPTTVPTTVASQAGEVDVDVDGEVVESESVHRRIQGVDGTQISSVVRADVGYLAAVWDGFGPTLLYSSIDGIEWTGVEASFPDEITRARTAGNFVLSHLRRTPVGYSLLVHANDGDGLATVNRLASTNGIVWEMQATVEAAPSSSSVYPLLHGDSIWAYTSMAAEGNLVAQLLESSLVDGESLSAIHPCWVEAEGDELATVFACDISPPIQFTADDFVDGVSIPQLARCVEDLGGLSADRATIVDTATGEELRSILVPRTVQVASQLSNSGAVIGVIQNFPWSNDVSRCDGLIDIPPTSAGSGVLIWDNESTEARAVPLPDGLGTATGQNWREAFVQGDSLVLLEAGELWTLDLESLEWSDGTRFVVRGFTSSALSDDGNALVSIALGNNVYVTDLDTSSTRIVGTGLPDRFDWIVYADADIALVTTPSGMYRIDLNA